MTEPAITECAADRYRGLLQVVACTPAVWWGLIRNARFFPCKNALEIDRAEFCFVAVKSKTITIGFHVFATAKPPHADHTGQAGGTVASAMLETHLGAWGGEDGTVILSEGWAAAQVKVIKECGSGR
jgi:hypothetical protein